MPQAAERSGVSPARIRQRIKDGSLVAEKIGGRWLVDLEGSHPQPAQLGRPVSPSAVWWSLASAEVAKLAAPHRSLLTRMRLAERVLADLSEASISKPADERDTAPRGEQFDFMTPGLVAEAKKLSLSSRNRAIHRFAGAVEDRDPNTLLAWLRNRGARIGYVAAGSDLAGLRDDDRLAMSGVSHPDPTLYDTRIVEAYASADDVNAIVGDFWLEKPGVDERPNVVLHVVPIRPPEIGPLLLAADLAEHGGPREVQRAHELLSFAMNTLSQQDVTNEVHPIQR